MPIGQKTVTPTFPKTQNTPGSKCCQQGNQIKLSCSGIYPSEQVENNQYRMENVKKVIGKVQGGISHFITLTISWQNRQYDLPILSESGFVLLCLTRWILPTRKNCGCRTASCSEST
jgi:hypothetical protein